MKLNIHKMNVYGIPAEIAEFVTKFQSNFIQESVPVKSEEQSEVQSY